MKRRSSKFAQYTRCDIVGSMLPRTFRAAVWLFAALAATGSATAQSTPEHFSPRHFDATWLGARVGLGPNWLFSPNDNPAYAAPGYDDSGWRTVSTEKQLSDYGIHDISYAWYRMHVHVDPRIRELAVEVQYIQGSYEL